MEQVTQHTDLGRKNVSVYSRTPVASGKIMSGRALFSQEEERFAFVENPKRTNRSKLVLASGHASLRARQDGTYSINVVFTPKERYVKESLISEVRDLSNAAIAHALDVEAEQKEKSQKKPQDDGHPSQQLA